jgi:hypothetical protein
MTTENSSPARPSFGSRLWRVSRTTAGCALRLLFILLLGIGLGAAIYYGVMYGAPALYYQYMYPVQENTMRLDDLQARQEQGSQQLAERLGALQGRLEALEIQGDVDREAFSSLQARLDSVEASVGSLHAAQVTADASMESMVAAQATTETSLEGLQAAQATAGTSLESLQAAQATSQPRLDEMQSDMEALAQQQAEFDQALDELDQAVSQTSEGIQTAEAGVQAVDLSVDALERNLQLLKAMDLLTRAHLSLAQNNAGLARSEVEAAREFLSRLQTQLPAYQQDALVTILARLDLVLGNLPGATDLARADLEVAWQLLLQGLTGEGSELELTLTPTPMLTASPTLTTTATVTPTETPTP